MIYGDVTVSSKHKLQEQDERETSAMKQGNILIDARFTSLHTAQRFQAPVRNKSTALHRKSTAGV